MDSDSVTSRSPFREEPLWRPTDEQVRSTQIDRFRLAYRPEAADTDALWRWSVDEPGAFWRAVWDWSGMVGDPGEVDVDPGDRFQAASFLPQARLNVAENLLMKRDGAEEPAIIAAVENRAGADSDGTIA